MDERHVLLALPDVNGSLRGKALSADAFNTAARDGTVMTDLIVGLDPVDTPIADFATYADRRAHIQSEPRAADISASPAAHGYAIRDARSRSGDGRGFCCRSARGVRHAPSACTAHHRRHADCDRQDCHAAR